jgi:Ras GTPase-activating-like protein IQGAP2/3
MANKKASTYANSPLAIGRKLGRHLPRIASGDGNEHWEQEAKVDENEDILDFKQRRSRRQEPSQEETDRVREEVRRERRARRREYVVEDTPTSPSKAEFILPVPTGGDDVQGMRGRLRLSRQPGNVPSTPTSPPAPRFGLWADVQRHLLQAYEYLCHVGEAQQWIEGCLGEELPFGVVEMEEGLRNGVVLAKLARVWEGEAVVKRIYEVWSH